MTGTLHPYKIAMISSFVVSNGPSPTRSSEVLTEVGEIGDVGIECEGGEPPGIVDLP